VLSRRAQLRFYFRKNIYGLLTHGLPLYIHVIFNFKKEILIIQKEDPSLPTHFFCSFGLQPRCHVCMLLQNKRRKYGIVCGTKDQRLHVSRLDDLHPLIRKCHCGILVGTTVGYDMQEASNRKSMTLRFQATIWC
jgi:hypothetical protein